VARLVMTADEAAVCEAVGIRSFEQARSLVASGDLVDVTGGPAEGGPPCGARDPVG
jgi:hypothetical protein